ncbi:citrate (pro-3S)-lyase subunit beta [Pigmentiphaga soli]|uniref:Citrate (Pro-3S)-lyase subunit beta n=1 Tax=Pigmentiphaga soli TaxID=1007095 RepID=A0ABP8H749_9BURK
MRSKLFVPGSRPELFAKAFASAADGISIDLEDAVAEARKPQARMAVKDWLQQHAHGMAEKTLIVRVNAQGTEHFEKDLHAVVSPGVQLINLPKPESAQAVRAASAAIASAEAANGVATPVGLLLNIETPAALRRAAELACADPRVVGLQLGLGDLFEPWGMDRAEHAAVVQAMFAVRMAAAEAGIYALDGAFADVADADGYRKEAELARRLGFIGKTCVHPKQVMLANDVFQPSASEIAYALKVEAAAIDATARGLGAYMVEGRMVDAPFARRAQAQLQHAHRLGLISTPASAVDEQRPLSQS